MKERLLALFFNKKIWIAAAIILLFTLLYFTQFRTLTFSVATETEQMAQLETTKSTTELAEFTTDGCSGGISANWSAAITTFESAIAAINPNYVDVETLPIEAACVEHDRKYHQGIGGYVGRLRADNALRSGIIAYGIDNAEDIQTRANLDSPEQAINLYETIAEAVYRGVRLGGAPCTGEAYAWGYGYNAGNCTQ